MPKFTKLIIDSLIFFSLFFYVTPLYAGNITGQVTDSSGGILGVQVEAWTYFYDPYGGLEDLKSITTTDLSGYYTLPVAGGTYRVNFNGNATGHISEWYNDKVDIASADTVPVTEPFTTSGVNAQLFSASSISGQVKNTGGNGIANVEVEAWANYTDPYTAAIKSSSITDLNGYYNIPGLVPDDYAVYFNTPNYVAEWYNDQPDAASSDPVTIVTEGSAITGINATLDDRGFISGQVTDLSGGILGVQVEAWTYFYDPYGGVEDLKSITTTDLNGYYTLPVAGGTYKVHFNENATGHTSEWYNDKVDITTADNVPVTELFTTGGVDAVLMSVIAQYTVTANATGNGYGTVSSSVGGINYTYQTNNTSISSLLNHGSSITITANANTGSTVSWSGCASTGGTTTSATCTFSNLDGYKTVTATFVLNQYTLTVNLTGKGSGIVTSTPGAITCKDICIDIFDYGTVVTLSPLPDSGSKFIGWSGDTDCEDGEVTINTDVNCEAIFYRFPWPMFLPAITKNAQP